MRQCRLSIVDDVAVFEVTSVVLVPDTQLVVLHEADADAADLVLLHDLVPPLHMLHGRRLKASIIQVVGVPGPN